MWNKVKKLIKGKTINPKKKSRTVLARQVMTANVVSVHPDTPVLQAIDILLENRISGLPVVLEDNKLVGIVSEKDLLQLLLTEELDEDDTVEQFMSKKVLSFEETDEIVPICEFFIKHNIRRVPIVKEGTLVGIISRRDILRLILVTVINQPKEGV